MSTRFPRETQAVLDALSSVLTDRQSEALGGRIRAGQYGDPDAIEWLIDLLKHVEEAQEAIQSVIDLGIMSSHVAVATLAQESGLHPTTIYRRIADSGVTVIDAPRRGYGPKSGAHIRRRDITTIGFPAAGRHTSDPAAHIPAVRIPPARLTR